MVLTQSHSSEWPRAARSNSAARASLSRSAVFTMLRTNCERRNEAASQQTRSKSMRRLLTCLGRCGVELELWLVALKAADVFVELLPKRAQLRNERLAQHVLRDVRAASAHAVSSRAAARASAVRGARLMKVIVMISSHNANVSAMKIQL